MAMARHGTTTVEAKSGYGLDAAAEMKTLRVLHRFENVTPTYLGAHVAPPERSADEYIAWMCSEMLPVISAAVSSRASSTFIATPERLLWSTPGVI